MMRTRWGLALLACLGIFAQAAKGAEVNSVVVDKKTNSLYLMKYANGALNRVKTYRTTLGLIPGDKRAEGDRKTPEGIYLFEEVKRAPNLAKKFGSLALTMNYPNPWDRMMKHTGSGIWLHATDEPKRLERNLDSLGCVVLKDEELADLSRDLNPRLSPILIFEDLEKQGATQNPAEAAKVESFVQNWAKAWSSKDLDGYIGAYHAQFTDSGKNLDQWRAYKKALNQRYKEIDVQVNNIVVFTHPKYYMVMFNQSYDSKLPGGAHAKSTSGVKILYVTAEKDGYKILAERFRNTKI